MRTGEQGNANVKQTAEVIASCCRSKQADPHEGGPHKSAIRCVTEYVKTNNVAIFIPTRRNRRTNDSAA